MELEVRRANYTSGRARRGKDVSAGQEMAIAEQKNKLELSRIDKDKEMALNKAKLDHEVLRLEYKLLQMQIEERLNARKEAIDKTVKLHQGVIASKTSDTSTAEKEEKTARERVAMLARAEENFAKARYVGGMTKLKEDQAAAQVVLDIAEAHTSVVREALNKAETELPILQQELAGIPETLAETAHTFARIGPLLAEQFEATKRI